MKKWIIILLLCTGIPWLFAIVDIELGSGIVIETTSGTYVEIDGDISGTGYFSGKLSSGTRTGVTTFAGLTLSSGMNGTIVRTTGSAYAKGNGEAANMKRYYEINNTGGSAVTANMTAAYVGTGTYDEDNGMTGPFFIFRYASSTWIGNGDGSASSPVSASGVQIPTGTSDWILTEGVRLAVKVFLEGPYNDSSDEMATTINDTIPKTSTHTENARTVASIPSTITDWVLLQLRSTSTGSTISSKSVFLRKDGKIVADDGTTEYFNMAANPGDYFIVIKNRNHLSVMSDEVHTLASTSSTLYDFTVDEAVGVDFDKYHGGEAAILEGTDEDKIYGMFAGDVNQNGEITTEDYTAWYNDARTGASGYQTCDIDMDGEVTTSDYTKWYNNARIGASSNVPNP